MFEACVTTFCHVETYREIELIWNNYRWRTRTSTATRCTFRERYRSCKRNAVRENFEFTRYLWRVGLAFVTTYVKS